MNLTHKGLQPELQVFSDTSVGGRHRPTGKSVDIHPLCFSLNGGIFRIFRLSGSNLPKIQCRQQGFPVPGIGMHLPVQVS